MPRRRFQKRRPRRKVNLNARIKKVLYRQAESKFFDDTATDTSLINTDARSLDGSIDFGSIVEGTDVNERIGNSIFVTGISINLLFTTTVSASLRIMLIQFPNSEAGLDLSPLDSVGVNGQMPRQNEIEARYKVLWSRNMDVDPDSKGSVAIKKFVRYQKKVVYKDGVAQPYANQCRLYVFTNNTTASAIVANADCRIMYKDV